MQFPYKIPAGEAQRDFPVPRGHPPRLFLPAFLPAGELRFCVAKWEFFKLPSNFSPELTERQRGQLLPSPQKVTLRLRCSLVNALTTLWLATNFLRKRARAQLFPYPAARAFAPQLSQPSQKSADAAKCLPIFTSSLFTIHFSLPGRADFWKGIAKREE